MHESTDVRADALLGRFFFSMKGSPPPPPPLNVVDSTRVHVCILGASARAPTHALAHARLSVLCVRGSLHFFFPVLSFSLLCFFGNITLKNGIKDYDNSSCDWYQHELTVVFVVLPPPPPPPLGLLFMASRNTGHRYLCQNKNQHVRWSKESLAK